MKYSDYSGYNGICNRFSNSKKKNRLTFKSKRLQRFFSSGKSVTKKKMKASSNEVLLKLGQKKITPARADSTRLYYK